MISFKHISDITQETIFHIDSRKNGEILPIKTPWIKLNDNNLGGFQWGDFITIPAMSGSGKTAFAAQFIRDAHAINPLMDFIILFFTFEMPGYKILLRDIIANTKISRKDLLSINGPINKFQSDKASSYLNSLNQKEIYFIEKPCNIEDYIGLCKFFYKEYGKKIIAIADHSLLFKNRISSDERGSLTNISERIMDLKNEGWSTHILLSQLNRDIESAVRRTSCSPLNYLTKSDMFGSDSLYQCSDNVIGIHRPYLLKFVGHTYGPDKLPTEKDDVYFHCMKLREGEPCDLKMKANFSEMKIEDDYSFRLQ